MKLKGTRGKHMFFACGVPFWVFVAAKQPLLQHHTQSSHSKKQGSRKNYTLEHLKRSFPSMIHCKLYQTQNIIDLR